MYKDIEIRAALKLKDAVFVDTRSPAEFDFDTIPGAVNIPLLSNEERAVVGTIYTKIGKQEALDRGMEFVSKKLPNMLKAFNKHKGKNLIIFCWRGGMRSKSIAALMDSIGFKTQRIRGGYKAYRGYVLEELDKVKIPKLVVLHGLTGTGKTKLVNAVKNSLDLEGFAEHRSSRFGAVGLKPKSQKHFESILLHTLKNNKSKYLIVEGESKKIGNVHIPERFFNAMKKGIDMKVECSMDVRVQNILEDYKDITLEELDKILTQIKVGKKNKEKMLALFKENKIGEVVKILFETYYDPKYTHSIGEKNYQLVVNNDDVSKAAKKIEAFCKKKFK